jgi:hypothetical protein
MKKLNLTHLLFGLIFVTSGAISSETGASSKPAVSSKAVKPSTDLESSKSEPQVPVEEKKKALRGTYFGLGPAGLWNLNSAGIAYYVTGGYTFDLNPVSMKFEGEFFGRLGAIGLVGGLGVSYFPNLLSSKDLSPFIGFDMGYGTARVNGGSGVFEQWVPAMVIAPSLGVQFFKNADVSLELALKWGFFLASGNAGSPSYSLLKLSFYFH